ncbi:Kanadaptin [Mortierella sp. AD011]|nr:Kanadaptin [Mortierella sp. AD010]KAF9389770.1 Kanadaptin [Mortierella sp. AD011]
MSFAVPSVPTKSSRNSGNGAIATPISDTADVEKTSQGNVESKSTFAVPSLPVKKQTAMAPPPPPLFPKDNETPRKDGSTQEKRSVQASNDTKQPVVNAPPLKYQKPAWSGYPNQQFYFEVIKNGVVVEKINAPEKEFIVIGRLPMCDLEMEHPSLSRYHAVVQFKSNGECFIYDLNSSHGTKLNKNKIPPGMHVSLKPGDQLRFGESTRIYLFQTEEAVDQEEEERKMVAAMIERQNKTRAQQREQDDEEEQEFNWGMPEDAVDEDDMDDEMMDGSVRRAVDPDAYYRKDPKKALRNYLESRGYSCEFEVEEEGPGHAREYTARIRLPIETSMGPVYGQAVSGRRRDAEREAALDACIQLDSRGMLATKSSSEGPSQAKSKKMEQSDDDDDDDFYDRTVKKKSSVAKKEQKAETHESLLEKHRVLQIDMAALEVKIKEYDANEEKKKQLEASGDIDAYIAFLEKSGGDSKAKMQQNLMAMKKEERRLKQLIEFTKPMDIMAKIGTNASATTPVKSDSSSAVDASSSGNEKHHIESDAAAVGEVKKPRILGPSLPPPS